MQEAWSFIFNTIYAEVVNPLRSALISSGFVNNLAPKLNNILSGIFNLFRGTPTDKYDSIINNNSLAEFFGLFIFILFLIFIFKTFKFVISFSAGLMKAMLMPDDIKGSKEWRRQWRSKKWKDF